MQQEVKKQVSYYRVFNQYSSTVFLLIFNEYMEILNHIYWTIWSNNNDNNLRIKIQYFIRFNLPHHRNLLQTLGVCSTRASRVTTVDSCSDVVGHECDSGVTNVILVAVWSTINHTNLISLDVHKKILTKEWANIYRRFIYDSCEVSSHHLQQVVDDAGGCI